MPCRGPEPLDYLDKSLVAELKYMIERNDKYNADQILWKIELMMHKYTESVVLENQNLTKWLCYIAKQEGHNLNPVYSKFPEFKKWKKTHDKADEKRRFEKENKEREERIKKEALNKLTWEERNLLGL